ncbi:hypothetical protein VNI00_000548 [Paramarasmius palmivorus]|uniref:F-box domain-containing protein n=1 Tax=Paramarasmius palmivorus TaxID=297713 RepID=A0AAW0E9K5_9AGAR
MATGESSTVQTRMERLFRSTVSPSDRNVIVQFLRDSEKELNTIKAAIMALESKRNGVKKKMERYRSLLAPVHRLPPEILVQVFVECCDENELRQKFVPPAYAISRVCGRWRELALSTPRLWSSLMINFYNWKGQGSRLASLTQEFIDRSRTMPLTLDLNFGDAWDAEDVGHIVPALDGLKGHCTRWQSVELDLVPWIMDSQLVDIMRNVPTLEHLGLSSDGFDLEPEFTNNFGTMPSLQSLVVPSIFSSPNQLAIPWWQLKKLELRCTTIRGIMAFIASSTNLEHLTLSGDYLTDGVIQGNFTIAPNLQSLELHPSRPENLPQFFDHVTLPKLSSLEIWGSLPLGPGAHPVYDMTSVMDLVSRSSCQITSLLFSWMKCPEGQVVSLIRRMPSLSTLEIVEMLDSNSIVCSTFLNQLHMDLDDPSQPCLLPDLSELHLSELHLSVHFKGLDTRALLDMLSSRCISVSGTGPSYTSSIAKGLKLVSVRVRGQGDEVEEFLDSLRCFENVGVCMDVSSRK